MELLRYQKKKKKEGGGQKANRHFLRTQWQMCLLG